jgi:hypothetical protein
MGFYSDPLGRERIIWADVPEKEPPRLVLLRSRPEILRYADIKLSDFFSSIPRARAQC